MTRNDFHQSLAGKFKTKRLLRMSEMSCFGTICGYSGGAAISLHGVNQAASTLFRSSSMRDGSGLT
jgi:hypothetical protein